MRLLRRQCAECVVAALVVLSVGACSRTKTAPVTNRPASQVESPRPEDRAAAFFAENPAFQYLSASLVGSMPGSADSVAAWLAESGMRRNGTVWEYADSNGTTQVSYLLLPSQRMANIIFRPSGRQRLATTFIDIIRAKARVINVGCAEPFVTCFELNQIGMYGLPEGSECSVSDEVAIDMRDGAWLETARTVSHRKVVAR